MKLLIITSNPDRGSFKDRILAYMDLFKQQGIEPTVAVLDRSYFKRVAQYRRADEYDVVLLHKKCLNFVDALAFKPRKTRVLFNYDDAIMFNDKGLETRTHWRRFKRSLARADKVLVGSAYLADQAKPFHNDIEILPLGLKSKGYGSGFQKPNDGKIRLVWIGRPVTLDYIRSLGAVFKKLAKRYPHMVLRMISEEFIDFEGVPMEKILWTPQMRFRGLAESDIGLAPLPDNIFTRGKCTFKVLEYSASGLPVVASPCGTNPEHIKHGETGFLVTSDQQWCDRLSELIENEPLRLQMGGAGKDFAARFDADLVGLRLCELIRRTAR